MSSKPMLMIAAVWSLFILGCGNEKTVSVTTFRTDADGRLIAETRTEVGSDAATRAQLTRAQDSAAKSNARNAVTELESCYVEQETYAGCNLSGSGLPVGSDAGMVEIAGDPAPDESTYRVVAHSESGNAFTLSKRASGVLTRNCTVEDDDFPGGCSNGADW